MALNSRSSEVLPSDMALIEWRSKAKIISMVDEDWTRAMTLAFS
jgi:hypothetical protein